MNTTILTLLATFVSLLIVTPAAIFAYFSMREIVIESRKKKENKRNKSTASTN